MTMDRFWTGMVDGADDEHIKERNTLPLYTAVRSHCTRRRWYADWTNSATSFVLMPLRSIVVSDQSPNCALNAILIQGEIPS